MNKKRTVTAVTLVFFAVLMLVLNFNTIYYSDDWHFMYVFEKYYPTGYDRRMENFSDIIYSAKQYYLLSGGRVLPHFVIFVLMMYDKWVFNILNTLMFMLFGWLICDLARKLTGCKNAMLLPITYFTTIIAIPRFGTSVLWLSGSVNYLWTSVLNLFCVKCFLDNIDSSPPEKCI